MMSNLLRSTSTYRHNNIPTGPGFRSLDAGLVKADTSKCCEHLLRRSQRKDIGGIAKATHPLFRQETDNHTTARRKYPVNFF